MNGSISEQNFCDLATVTGTKTDERRVEQVLLLCARYIY